MKKIIAGFAIVCCVATLPACEKLKNTLGPEIGPPQVITLHEFAYYYKKLPAGTSLAAAKTMMEQRDPATRLGASVYFGNKLNNTLFYQLRAVPPAANGAHRGQLMISARDLDVTVPGATGVFISATPLPLVGDTITSADVHIYISEVVSGNPFSGALPVEYQNANNPNSYFKLVLMSLNRTTNRAVGVFEALVQSPSGDIYAITNGEFTMRITN